MDSAKRIDTPITNGTVLDLDEPGPSVEEKKNRVWLALSCILMLACMILRLVLVFVPGSSQILMSHIWKL